MCRLTALAGPDDYIFDKKWFPFMGFRLHSCPRTYFKVPMGVQQMSYGMGKGVPFRRDVDKGRREGFIGENLSWISTKGRPSFGFHGKIVEPNETANLSPSLFPGFPEAHGNCHFLDI